MRSATAEDIAQHLIRKEKDERFASDPFVRLNLLTLGIFLSHKVKRTDPGSTRRNELLFDYHPKMDELLRPRVKALHEYTDPTPRFSEMKGKFHGMVRDIAMLLAFNGFTPSIFNEGELTRIADLIEELLPGDFAYRA